ncbi:hypothetical protein [Microbacterium schleiferi]|uniref:DUF7937 domain-containing protein n=1 Tax=Microbacterium schleiferi TaxID=69362 RepID=UPI00311FABDD
MTYPAPEQPAYQGQYVPYPAAPVTRGPSPLSSIPVSDWVRDAVAVALLLVSLALPWSLSFSSGGLLGDSFTSTAATRVDVLLITILSVLSVAVTVLARAGALGTGLTPGRTAALRAALNAPYAILVVVYMVLDAVSAGEVAQYLGVGSGLGAAVTVGLAGALFAATPRLHEIRDPLSGGRLARAGVVGVFAVLAVMALTMLIGFILLLLAMPWQAISGWDAAAAIVALLLQDAALALPAVLVLRRSPTAPRIAGSVGIAVVAGIIISALTGFELGGTLSSLHGGGYILVWFGAYAALLTSPALLASMTALPPLNTWFLTARQALVTLTTVSTILAAFAVIALVTDPSSAIGFSVGILLSQVLAAGVALVARIHLVGAPQTSRTIVLCLMAAVAVGEIVALVLSAVSPRYSGLSLEPVLYLALLGLPAVVAYALVAPREVREYFGTFAPPAAPMAYQYDADQYRVAAPAAPAPPATNAAAPASSADYYAARAADPLTPAEELYQYTSDPSLWPSLAANPALYPELVTWLASTGDPHVLAVLRSRGAI